MICVFWRFKCYFDILERTGHNGDTEQIRTMYLSDNIHGEKISKKKKLKGTVKNKFTLLPVTAYVCKSDIQTSSIPGF